ncbi:MAG: hypothetical protein KJ995_08035 [Candidatus Omnitrophica bacterium]|nr:hypothetical protein [Candidatus Omnitrophota bacterium]
MAIREIESVYGAVLYRLINNSGRALSVGYIPNDSRGFFLVNEKVPLCIKYATKKISPWVFTFTKKQQDDLQEVRDIYGSAVIVFVCGHDGVCAVRFDEFKEVLDYYHEEVENVTVRRKRREKYSVSGSDGELKHKVGDNYFPKIIDEILGEI